MKLVPRGAVLGALSPALVFVLQVEGLLLDPAALSYAVFDASNEAKELAPVEVLSSTELDVTEAGPSRLGPGRYAAVWEVDDAAPLGAYEIRWRYQLTEQGPVYEARERFEVVVGLGLYAAGPFYCGLAQLRAEGLLSAELSDARALAAIQRASQFIERVTRRFFEPRYQTLLASGSGRAALLLEHPIIALDALSTDSEAGSALLLEDESAYRVFNRHLVGGPDDRESPKIELYTGSGLADGWRFGRGVKNVRVTGVFGYTDASPNPWGVTPLDIERVAIMLVIRDAAKLRNTDAREDARWRGRITGERTRDQSYTVDSAKDLGHAVSITGDPEVDQILMAFRAPPLMGAA